MKTQAGEYLADYALQNPDTVSLIDLYKDLVSAAQQLEHYFSYFNPMEHQSNVDVYKRQEHGEQILTTYDNEYKDMMMDIRVYRCLLYTSQNLD